MPWKLCGHLAWPSTQPWIQNLGSSIYRVLLQGSLQQLWSDHRDLCRSCEQNLEKVVRREEGVCVLVTMGIFAETGMGGGSLGVACQCPAEVDWTCRGRGGREFWYAGSAVLDHCWSDCSIDMISVCGLAAEKGAMTKRSCNWGWFAACSER